MIVLTETTDNLQSVLGDSVAANQAQCMSCWRDITTTGYTPGRTLVNTNNTTDVNIVPAPNSSTQRVVDFVSVYNADTANITVTVKLDANGTEYVLFRAILGTLERLTYVDGTGWTVYTVDGAPKTSVNQGANASSSSISTTVLSADRTNNNGTANTIADVTGLSFAVVSGTYWFRFVIWYTAAATTTGSRWTINGPSNSLLGFRQSVGLSAAGTAGTDVMTEHNAGAYDTPAASNASSPTATAGQANIAIIEGLITATASGTVIARFASEVSSSAIVAKAGSVVYYQKVV